MKIPHPWIVLAHPTATDWYSSFKIIIISLLWNVELHGCLWIHFFISEGVSKANKWETPSTGIDKLVSTSGHLIISFFFFDTDLTTYLNQRQLNSIRFKTMNVEITCMLILLAEELFQLSIKVECSVKNVCKFRKENLHKE